MFETFIPLIDDICSDEMFAAIPLMLEKRRFEALLDVVLRTPVLILSDERLLTLIMLYEFALMLLIAT